MGAAHKYLKRIILSTCRFTSVSLHIVLVLKSYLFIPYHYNSLFCYYKDSDLVQALFHSGVERYLLRVFDRPNEGVCLLVSHKRCDSTGKPRDYDHKLYFPFGE